MSFANRFLSLIALLWLGACSATDILNATIPRDGYRVASDIAYGINQRQKLDLYIPTTAAADGCAILFVYGGSWQNGDRGDYAFAGQALSETGCLVAIPDYRVYPNAPFPAFISDTASALDWLHDNAAQYGARGDRLFVMGHSAGAYNGMMALLYPPVRAHSKTPISAIKGFVGLSGPYDFLPFTDDDIKAVFAGVDAAQTQPITHARTVTTPLPPILLITGYEDTTVLPRNSYNLAQVLRDRKYAVEVREYKGVAHVGMALSLARGFRHIAPTLGDIKTFVKDQSLSTNGVVTPSSR